MSKPDVSAVKDFDKNQLKQVETDEKTDLKARKWTAGNYGVIAA